MKFRHFFGKVLLLILEVGKPRPVLVVFFCLSVCSLGVIAHILNSPELLGPVFLPPQALEGAPGASAPTSFLLPPSANGL